MPLYKKAIVFKKVIYKRIIDTESTDPFKICAGVCRYSCYNNNTLHCYFSKRCNSDRFHKRSSKIFYIPE